MHHSGYYLVSLIFGTIIPTSFNIQQFNWRRRRKCGLANFHKSLQLCILCTIRFLVDTKHSLSIVYVSKMACNCRVWEFWAILFEKVGVVCRRHPHIESTDSLIESVHSIHKDGTDTPISLNKCNGSQIKANVTSLFGHTTYSARASISHSTVVLSI